MKLETIDGIMGSEDLAGFGEDGLMQEYSSG